MNSALDAQYMSGVFIYGMDGNGGVDGSGDVTDINKRQFNDQLIGGSGAIGSQKFYFDSCIGRCVLTNVGTSQAIVEVYTCYARRDISTGKFGSTLETMLTTMFGATYNPTLNAAASAANATQQTTVSTLPTKTYSGMTPFQCRVFCQHFKILKVNRFQIAPNNEVAWDFRDRRNRTFDANRDDTSLLARQGWTRMLLFRSWGSVVNNAGLTQNAATSVVCEIEKDYMYKVLEQNTPEISYVAYTNTTE